MSKLIFAPFRMLTGVLAGIAARRLFARVWSLIDRESTPSPARSGVSVGRLASALVLEGAVFSAVRGLADHGSRAAFRRLTGVWPGERAVASEDAPRSSSR